ncbi:hypothetical protein ASD12_18055 [Mesorhizobium sp. Root102]|uniref:hypothetical protein n=1 Tax=Mesorhizobium sp. Root102 TaxID=1736422 RepID=UPI0006FECAD4|nr:hypothetical protein [Mesorhizobium sp. Root102]KQU77704.1 hypothetical protein ASD12_18055 [Mesorhizobium sp. Root102]
MAELEDRREDILARLLVVAGGIDPTLNPLRNETSIPDSAMPAVVVLDGKELANPEDPFSHKADTKRRVAMMPEVQFRLASTAKNVGTDLNRMRRKLIDAVLTDTALLALTINGKSIRYDGSNTVTERGRSMEGGIGVGFTFTYALEPAT